MLALLGAMGVLMAGVALPLLFDEVEDDDAPEDEPEAERAEAGTGDLTDDPEDESVAEVPSDLADEAPPGEAPVPAEAADTPPASDPVPEAPMAPLSSAVTAPAGPIAGTDTDDVLRGSDRPEAIDGGFGDDVLRGEGGDDTLDGGAGDDRMLGLSGDDLLSDGDGADTLRGGGGADTIAGDARGAPDGAPDGRDHLHGGAGDDSLHVGRMDFATGGAGADDFTLAPGIGIGEQAEIVDFDPEEDRLVLLWDDSSGGPPPEITLGKVEDSDGLMRVLADGIVVAHVAGGSALSVADISLVGTSAL
jgi:hypothetical protein